MKEDDNPHDHLAISVWDEGSRVMIGYLPRDKNEAIKQAMAELGRDGSAIVLAQSIKDKRRVGMRVMFGPLNVQ